MPSEDLKTYYPQKGLVADGGTIPELTADSGSIDDLIDAALTEIDGYWASGLVLFSGDTTTVALQEYTAHIRSFDAATDKLTFAKALPAAVVAGDTYKIMYGGGFRSDMELLGTKVDGQIPDVTPLALTTITGVTVRYVSGGFIDANISIDWDNAVNELSVDSGVVYTVTGDASGVVIYSGAVNAFMIVDIIQSSLPASVQNEILIPERQRQTVTPDVEGYESVNATKGKIRYRLTISKNESGGVMNNFKVGAFASADSTTMDNVNDALLDETPFLVADGSIFPAAGFWVYHAGYDDFRYIRTRSGNELTPIRSDSWTVFTMTANNTVEPFIGDLLTGVSAATGGYIQSIKLISGTWAGGDAVAEIILSGVESGESFSDTEQVQISAVNIALVTGSEAKGLRGKTAVVWDKADSNPMFHASSIDIAYEADPSPSAFSSPATERDYPDNGLTFNYAYDVVAGLPLSIGSISDTVLVGIWQREWIVDDMAENVELIADLEYTWF